MPQANVVMDVQHINDRASIIHIQGDITSYAEPILMEAYSKASTATVRAIVLDFTGLSYMNSSGIGLLVTLLIRANRQKQQMLAYGLSEHYRHIFKLTRISDVIKTYDTQTDALAATDLL